jgi:hypothetical protein
VHFAQEVSAMGRTLDEMLRSLPAAQRAAVARRGDALIADELSLRDLRKVAA